MADPTRLGKGRKRCSDKAATGTGQISVCVGQPSGESHTASFEIAELRLLGTLGPGEIIDRLTIDLLKVSAVAARDTTSRPEIPAAIMNRLAVWFGWLATTIGQPNHTSRPTVASFGFDPANGVPDLIYGSHGEVLLEWCRWLDNPVVTANPSLYAAAVHLGVSNSRQWLAEDAARRPEAGRPELLEIQRLNEIRCSIKKGIDELFGTYASDLKIYR